MVTIICFEIHDYDVSQVHCLYFPFQLILTKYRGVRKQPFDCMPALCNSWQTGHCVAATGCFSLHMYARSSWQCACHWHAKHASHTVKYFLKKEKKIHIRLKHDELFGSSMMSSLFGSRRSSMLSVWHLPGNPTQKVLPSTVPGLEPRIAWSVVRRLIHWATRPTRSQCVSNQVQHYKCRGPTHVDSHTHAKWGFRGGGGTDESERKY